MLLIGKRGYKTLLKKEKLAALPRWLILPLLLQLLVLPQSTTFFAR
jgi:hypothetical protein